MVQSLADPNFFSYRSLSFLPFFFPSFALPFSPLSSSNFSLPFPPAFLPSFFLLQFFPPTVFFCHSYLSFLIFVSFYSSHFCCFSFTLSSLYFILLISSSFTPPLSFSLFLFLFLFCFFFLAQISFLFQLFANGAAMNITAK